MSVELLRVEPPDGKETLWREDLRAAALLTVKGVRAHDLALRGSGALLHQHGGQLQICCLNF